MRPTFDSMGFTPEEAMDSLSEDVVEAGHEIDRLRAALAKAEAERDEAKAELAFHRAANMALVKERDDAQKWLETNAEFANHWRARADRYLAAMTEYVDVSDPKEIESAYAAIRALVEEARRG